MKAKDKKPSIKIFEKAKFEFGHMENAQRVAIALSMGGYYVKIWNNQSSYTVLVFTDREEQNQ